MTDLASLIDGLIGNETRNYLDKTLCKDFPEYLPQVFTGAALIMGGLLLQLGLTFWLGWQK